MARKYRDRDIDDIVFNILNKDVVTRLVKDKKVKLPAKKVKVPKDKRWNAKQMSSKLLAGIQSGDNIEKIARSMREVIDANRKSALRNTRTMFTSAENHGRLDSCNSLTEQGVVMEKEWIATPDDRTRPSHEEIDGEQQPMDKPFSNGCMFPGDASGPPEEVWCCRCTMGTHVVGFRREDGSVSRVDYTPDKTTHEKQMKGL